MWTIYKKRLIAILGLIGGATAAIFASLPSAAGEVTDGRAAARVAGTCLCRFPLLG